ncbi:MAG: hypothetical protein IT258_05375 [Saprospiraceae bacterium]|nr:hypothetical protein [Saprospiraceae bacterium]
MRTSAIVLLLSLFANLSFARFSNDTIPDGQVYLTASTACEGGSNLCLVGDWMNISETTNGNGFASITIYGNGKFDGADSKGKRICGRYEISKDNLYLVFHKTCEKTGVDLGDFVAQIELLDGHMLSLNLPEDMGGKQLFIQ